MTTPHTPETEPTLAAEAFQAQTKYEALADAPAEAKAVDRIADFATNFDAREIFGADAIAQHATEHDRNFSVADAFLSVGDFNVAYNSGTYGHSMHRTLVVANKDQAVVFCYGDDVDAFYGTTHVAVHKGRAVYDNLKETNKFDRFIKSEQVELGAGVVAYHNPTHSTEVGVYKRESNENDTYTSVLADVATTAKTLLDQLKEAQKLEREASERRTRMQELLATLSVEDRVELLVQQIDGLSEGQKPYPVFLALAKKMPIATVELVPLRTNPETGKTEVLLTQRPDGDIWEGEWHVPGAAILASDEVNVPVGDPLQYEGAFKRLLGADGELRSGVKATHWPPVVLRPEHRKTRRGPESTVVNYVEVAEVPGKKHDGVWAEVDQDGIHGAPGVVIDHHVPFIIAAAEDYRNKRASNEAQGLQA